MAYTKQTWTNDDPETPLSATRLNHIEDGIFDAQNAAAPTADTLTGATAVGKSVMKATDAAAARTAIGAGTSNLTLGTTATTALKGDYAPAWADVTGKPTIPAATAAGTRAQLDAGTDTVVRAFSAKDISDFVAAKIAAAAA